MRCPANSIRTLVACAGMLTVTPIQVHAQRATGPSFAELSLRTDISRADEKSSGTAAVLSLILPGAGQFYNEEYGKGALMLVLTGVSVVMMIDGANEYDCDEDEDCWPWLLPAGAVLAVGNTIWSVVDASAGAKRWNKRHAAELATTGSLKRLPHGRIGLTLLAAGF